LAFFWVEAQLGHAPATWTAGYVGGEP
jgi:hypothetical protein